MSDKIIETIGSWGVKSVSTEMARFRMKKPKSGDVIDFGENVGTYPFTYRYGRIWEGPNQGFNDDSTVTVCCSMGSAFLNESGNVDISGGPFTSVKIADLEATHMLHNTHCWNWGDNSPGADQGVYYVVPRPVFLLKKLEVEK